MAYAALTSLAGVIDQILPQDQRYISLCGKDQMKSLHEKVSLLRDFLEYISLKTFLPNIDELESRIRDTSYKMEETIELVILSEPRKESESDVQLPTSDEFSGHFEEVGILLEEAMEMKKTLDKNAIPEPLHPLITTAPFREKTGSKGTKVGLDKPLNQILDRLTSQGSKRIIVSITGMGGIGKTTLARASYEAQRTLHHFDVRLWVTVSQEYNIQDILRGLLPEAEQTIHRDERLIEYVHKRLTGIRYLIVLDDMWDEKVWDGVMNALPDENKGSRVILTTRSSRVASYVGDLSPVHEMQFLNEDQTWDLLRENVYGHECCSPEFEDMGRMIAKNCKGLPLAVVVIAGLLKFNKIKDYWQQVARNTDEKAMITNNDHLFEILSWSYTRLPPHLKACFLYMGFYKEDYEIPRKELVMLWASEGFLKPIQSRSMEEVAEECLEELVQRSLVLVTKRNYTGKISTCSVHDVIREVSIRKAEEEKFHHHFTASVNDESTFRKILAVQRRVSITDCNMENFPLDTVCVATHSLIEQGEYNYRSMKIVQSFKLLRVLKKVSLRKDSDISILCTLTNLRYLHFFCETLSIQDGKSLLVPESISELQNLETLIVSASCCIVVFPSGIWKLQRLRHIISEGGEIVLPDPTLNQGRLVPSNLQTLDTKFVKNFVEIFPSLKRLILYYRRDFEEEYPVENLQYLHQLENLYIGCDSFYWDKPTNFVFPQNLKKLSLSHTKIPSENLPCIGSLPNLKVLTLNEDSLKDDEWEPIEGEFLQLEKLKMHDLYIRHWRAESKHFPCLRKLVIQHCNRLEEVPESIGEIDTLETIIVKVKNERVERSVQKIQETQQEMGYHLLQVSILYTRY